MSQTILVSNADELSALQAKHPIHVLYFTTPTCNVCKSIFPKLEQAVAPYPFPIFKMDASSLESVAGQYLVFGVPTIIMMVDGKEALRENRYVEFSKIERMLSIVGD